MVPDIGEGQQGRDITCDKDLMSYQLGVQPRKRRLSVLAALQSRSKLPNEL